MFEVNVYSPTELGALFGFLAVHRGPLSVLVHPRTGDDVWEHSYVVPAAYFAHLHAYSEGVTWMGRPWPLNLGFLDRMMKRHQS